jgi:hypothetical protein
MVTIASSSRMVQIKIQIQNLVKWTAKIKENQWLGLNSHPLFELDEFESIYCPPYENL